MCLLATSYGGWLGTVHDWVAELSRHERNRILGERAAQPFQRPRDQATQAPPALGLMGRPKRFFQSPWARRRRPRALSAGRT